jgi:membrane-associated phospholipid phosphatase
MMQDDAVMGQLRDLDVQALLATYGGAHGTWSAAMLALTVVGGGWSAVLLLPLLAWTRTRGFAGALTLTVIAQATSVWALKALVGRTRPWIALGLPPPFGAPHDGSFPSGHAAGCFCFAAFVVVVLPAVWTEASTRSTRRSGGARAGSPPVPARRAQLVAAAAIAFAALVALSRVYLGAHWPTDVLAGALMGWAFGVAGGSLYLARRVDSMTEPNADAVRD